MSFGRPASSGAGSSDAGSQTIAGAAQYYPRPGSARPPSRGSRRSGSSKGSDGTTWEMSMDEFKRQVQNQFTVVLSWDEVRALQKLYGDPDSGTIDFMKFAVALGKSPGHGHDKTRQAYNFLPKHTMEYDVRAIEKKIVHKLEDRCEVAGNYQYQWARRMLCDSITTMAGGMDKAQLKLRLSGLLGVELSDGEMKVLFRKYADPVSGRVHMQSFATRLLAPDSKSGWFFLDNQLREPVVTNRISPSARYHNRPGVEVYKPMDNVFPKCLKGFKWDMEKLVAKLKLKMHENAQGIAGYQFLAGCNLFRHEVPGRSGDNLTAEEFRHVVEYKFGMKLDPDEVLALFHFLVPGTGDSIEIAEMVRVLVPNDYTDSWFSTRESTDMFGFTKAAPDKVVLQAKKMSVGGSWNLSLIESKIREKIHERVGGTGVFEVQAAYTLFLDGRNTGLTKKGFKAQMHDKFAVVLSDKDVDDVFAKYDPKGTGSLDVHSFVLKIISPPAEPEPWFRDRTTYEFHVLNRAPMKKDPMKAECWDRTKWTFRKFDTTLRDKLMAKSSQDGGRFAYKSAVNLLRSANPDHLDSSYMDREALKFVIFRRFDIVMDDHLLDEVFARFDPEGTGKMPVHRLVQHLLPPSLDGSHHLVPKTEEQGQATKTLLGKIFGMTGKRREVINLNGSGVEDPQAQSLLERMAAGDKGDGEKIKAKLARKARAVAASAAAAEIAKTEAARKRPMLSPAAMAAMAASRRKEPPLTFSGDVVLSDAEATTHGALNALPSRSPETSSPRPETSSTNSSASSATGRARGSRDGGGGGQHGPLPVNASSGGGGMGVGGTGQGARVVVGARREGSGSDVLRERERQLDARERALREREDAIARQQQRAVVTPGSNIGGIRSGGAAGEVTNNAPAKSERQRLEAEVTKVRKGEVDGQRQPGRRAASVETRPPSSSSSSTECFSGNNDEDLRPESARNPLSRRSRAEGEASLIARCRALGAARRKAAASRRRSSARAKSSNRPETQTHQWPGGVTTADRNQKQATRLLPGRSGRPPIIPAPKKTATALTTSTAYSAAKEQRRRIETAKLEATETTRSIDGPVVTEGRIPSRPQSANAARRGRTCPRPRPRSAASSRSNGAGSDGHRGECLGGLGEDINGISTVKASPASDEREEYSHRGPPHGGTCRPASANAAVGDRAEQYRKRLGSAYSTQMRAMQRLQKRKSSKKGNANPERPASGGCQGIGAGQFRSRYSGLDRFVLARGMERARGGAVETGASRFGGGVPFYGC